jgi:SAM-dependent methyltransferase
MLRTTFDEAVQSFAPGSIDVLHIDGSHHYKDVEHDFAHWKERLRPDGIVLFHDISEDKVYGNIMGSHYFWEDLKKAYPWTAEFPFSLGLGVLFWMKVFIRLLKNRLILVSIRRAITVKLSS